MIEFNKYYRLNAILKKAQMKSAPIIGLAEIGLPFKTALHYAVLEAGVMGIQPTNVVFRGLDKGTNISVGFGLPDLTLVPGKAIQKSVRFNEVVSKYMRTVPKWSRNDQEPSVAKQKQNVLVFNYGIYSQMINMQTESLADYHYFIGFWNNIFKNIKEEIANTRFVKNKKIVDTFLRHHFLMVESPTVIPSLKMCQGYSLRDEDTAKVNALGSPDRWFIAELWKWLGGSGETIFSNLSDVELKQINIMFTRAGSATLLNLYVLKYMASDRVGVKGKADVDILFEGQAVSVMTTENLQKSLLLFLISFQTKVDSGIVTEVNTEEDLVEDSDKNDSNIDDDELDAPTEADATNRFLEDSNDLDAEEELGKAVLKKLRKKNGRDQVETPNVVSNELEDIFTDDNGQDDSAYIDETLEALDKINEELQADSAEPEHEETLEPTFSQEPETQVEDGKPVEGIKTFSDSEYTSYEGKPQTPEEAFMALVRASAEEGNLSAAEVRRFEAIAAKYRTTIKNPYGGEGTLADAAFIKPEDLLIPEDNKLTDKIPGVFNDSYLSSSHDKMHRHYNQNILTKDILSNSIALMRAGYAIDGYDVQKHDDIVDSYEIHTVRLVPIRGKPSTIKFRVPKVTPGGTFKAGGNINRMRVQRADIPIRKVKPGDVALTSYHSKMWVRRSPLVAFNFDKWIEKTLTNAATNPEKLLITNVSYGNCYDSTIDAPLTYTAISRFFASFVIGKYQFMWDVKKNDQFFGAEVMKVAKKYGHQQVLCGKGENSFIWMDYEGNLFEAPLEDRAKAIPIGTIPDLIGVDPFKIPVQSADLKIFSKSIPIGIALAYWIGLGNLLKTIGAKYRRVYGRELLNLKPNEFYVAFKNEKLVFDRNDKVTSLIMSGWNEYHAFIKFYSPYDFDKQETFGRFFYETKIEGRYENELTIIRQLWIDPITEGELVRLNEPTDMVNLFISAVKKLTYDKHPDPMDGMFQRDRGYERISGFVYDNMVRSVRGHRNRRFMKDAAIDMPPDAVWYDILKDQTTGIAEASNPIHSLKEQEVVVFRGAGGRSSQSMMAEDRKAHRSNVGRDSEATVDSGDVATVLYTTANPNYDSVRGTIRYTENPNDNVARAFGTSQLLAAAAEYDDPNRRNFVSIQNSRTTNSAGSTPLPVRTGYERVLAYRTDDLYATVSRLPGKVIAKTNKVIVVEYEDGTQQEIEIGLRYGEWSGKTMPHEVITDLKLGDTFAKDMPIAWGKNFFVKDDLTGGLLYKPGILARVILIDDEDTWEDSSAIHVNFAKKLTTERVDKRDIVVDANQEIRNLLPIGTEVNTESILCTIFNATEGNKELFNQESLDSLKDFTSNSPQAKSNGVITDIEAYYTGQVEDMSETLQDIVEASNTRLYKLNKALKKPALDGRVDVGTRFSGSVLNQDMVLTRIRILTNEGMDIGSKLVFCHQMKSVVGRKIVTRLETEAGEPIDAKFSNTSFSNRIVDSGNQVGTTGVLCVAATKAVIAAYRGTKK